MKITLLHDRILVRSLEEDVQSEGGIIIPDNAKEKPVQGEVVAIGNGKVLDNGQVRAVAVKAGDKVLFGKYAGTEVTLDGTGYLVMREDDVMAVLE